jgi:pimeloyl-ACP methyl ester carboxylesterase
MRQKVSKSEIPNYIDFKVAENFGEAQALMPHCHHYSWFAKPYTNSYALLSDASGVDTAVVFVHGFLGDPHDTFYGFQDMIESRSSADAHWLKRDLFFFTYKSTRNNIETSAGELLSFLDKIFPTPPDELLSLSPLQLMPKSLSSLNSPPRTYGRLVLVGHSEGGLVIRKAAILKRVLTGSNPISKAKLALFAPAISGVNPSRFWGMLLELRPINWFALPFLKGSLAYRDMSTPLYYNDVMNKTVKARETHPGHTALWAQMRFGADEDVVTPVEWPDDDKEEPEEPGKDHLSICKPKGSYDRPLTFVSRAWEEKQDA